MSPPGAFPVATRVPARAASDAEPSARVRLAIPQVTKIAVDALGAAITRIRTHLTAFIDDTQLDRCEAEVLAAMNELRELRLQIRQLRALARAQRRAA